MKNAKIFGSLLFLYFVFLQGSCTTTKPSLKTTSKSPLSLIPQNKSKIKFLKKSILKENKEKVSELTKSLHSKSSFKDSFGKMDLLRTKAMNTLHSFMLVELLQPSKEMQKEASKAIVDLRKNILENFDANKELYSKLKTLSTNLTPETNTEAYFILETMKNFRINAMELSSKKQKLFKTLNIQIQNLSSQFDKNIQHANRFVDFTALELEGVSTSVIKALSSVKGKKRATTDYPTYREVIKKAKSQETRKKMYEAFKNRAYPENYAVLEKLVKKRHKLARLLGFKSFADYDLSRQMAKSPFIVKTLLSQVSQKITKKAQKEIASITKDLPKEVPLSKKGKIFPWDFAFIFDAYKERDFKIDSQKISEFFPMEKTMTGLLEIYSKVFSLDFKEIKQVKNLWHDSVRMISVKKEGSLLGHIFLDLHPRKNKFSHARVLSLRPSMGNPQSQDYTPGAIVIIANNSKGTEEKPALFSHGEVSTFFHEFGHALHSILSNSELSFLSSSEMAMTYGLPVKTDFVEVPSTIFEKWLEDPKILQELSSHFKTGEKLDIDTVHKLIKLNHLTDGISLTRLVSLSHFCLDLYSKEKPNIQKLYKKYSRKFQKIFAPSHDDHFPAAFGHLTSYGAKYYSYLWSRIYAEDLFLSFKRNPLDTKTGEKFSKMVLEPGGSKKPQELLKNFLGREANPEAFFRSLEGEKETRNFSFN